MSLRGIQLRRATAADLAAIVALERASEGAPHWPSAAYAAIVESQNTDGEAQNSNGPQHRCLFVAEIGAEPAGAIVGFAVGLLHGVEAIAELESVAVAASARRAGVGRALCVAVLDWCRRHETASIILEVRAGSAAAIALYAGLGFVQAGRRPRYYRDPEDDALLLRLPLS